MAFEVDDEDVQLIAQALTHAGWHITTHTDGKKADSQLKHILQALVNAKAQELPAPLSELDAKQALALIVEAVSELKIDCKATHTPEVTTFSFMGHGDQNVVTGKGQTTVNLTLNGDFQIENFVNFLRDTWVPF